MRGMAHIILLLQTFHSISLHCDLFSSVVDPSVTPVCKICQQPAQPWAELLWYENKDKEYRIAEVEGSTSGIWLHKLCTQWSEGIKEMDENRVIGVDAVVERSRKEARDVTLRNACRLG